MNFKTLFENKWLELRETEDGYVYSHDGPSAGDGHKVAVCVVKPNGEDVLGRYEYTPCQAQGIKLCSITGSVENKDPISTAIHELQEEAGIKATPEQLLDLGEVWPSKSSDTICHLYGLVYDGEINDKPEGDGSIGERGATVKWVNVIEAMAANDPLLPTMLARISIMRLATRHALQEA
jgi:8-oxo-dGTP pyrophosphatase MutT (NUDIX family)